MSKAFLKESDFDEMPEIPRPVSTLPLGAKNYLTEGGAAKLRRELARLLDEERPPLAAKLNDPEIRRELQGIDHRIRLIEDSLRAAEIVSLDQVLTDSVRFGTLVTMAEKGATPVEYYIVGVDETAFFPNGLSWQSPLARALMNSRVGHLVSFQSPGGQRDLEVLRIERPQQSF